MQQTAAILISRQGLQPCQSTPWVVQSQKAVQWIKNNALHLITSIGQQTWEMLVFLAQQQEVEQTIVIPSVDRKDFENQQQIIIDQFCLKPDHISFKGIFSKNTKQILYQRDQTIITDSHLLIPISTRKKGHMETLIAKKPTHCIIKDFQIDYTPRKTPISYQIDTHQLSQKLSQLSSQYLIHWTRSHNRHWPTEKKFHYYQAITQSTVYPRKAMASLENILSLGQIKASARHMPLKIPTVSFSGLPPNKAVSLMQWRPRYCEMSFEPYGIGVEKNDGLSMGIQPVHYYSENQRPADIAPWLCQSMGKRATWKKENEYRFLGDFDLSHVPKSKLICFCYAEKEAAVIEQKYGVKSVAMLQG